MVGSSARTLHRSHYENFPVASFLLPAHMRAHVAAVYAFARVADDFADEGEIAAEERIALLDAWGERLHDAAHGAQTRGAVRPGEPDDAPQLFAQLGRTMREKSLPVDLFDALLSAFRQDVAVHRYETWQDLDDYCRRSANPVGRIVLRIAGYRDARMDGWSDAICTALQLTNFWQDLRVDIARGRLYVPREELRRHGADERQLAGSTLDAAWRAVIAHAVARTRRLFDEGRPVCDAVGGRLRLELRATWLGGARILDRLEAAGFDALSRRPVLGAADLPWFLGRLAGWRPAPDRE
jgi:squalene synthase HpnC